MKYMPLYLFAMILLVLPAYTQGTPKFVWGIWYNAYQKKYVTHDEMTDTKMYVEHLDHFQKIGINRIYFLAKFPTGHVFYDSKIAPKFPGLTWDPMAFLIQECHRRNIEFYPYVNVFPEGEYNEVTQEHDIIGPYLEKYPQHAMIRDDGKIYGWASPAVPEAVEYELSILEEIVCKYDIDGIQLDRIRYPDYRVDFHPTCIAKYKAKYGKEPHVDDYTWTQFRQDLLTEFLRLARQRIRIIHPTMPISAAVFPRPEAAPIHELQLWPQWCREGILDEVSPMSYYRNYELFAKYVQQELEVTPAHIPILSGIGAFFIEDVSIMEQQIQFAISHAVQGIVFFNGYHLLDAEKARLVATYAKNDTKYLFRLEKK